MLSNQLEDSAPQLKFILFGDKRRIRAGRADLLHRDLVTEGRHVLIAEKSKANVDGMPEGVSAPGRSGFGPMGSQEIIALAEQAVLVGQDEKKAGGQCSENSQLSLPAPGGQQRHANENQQ